ncbi:MAG: GAF domain-containing protein [Nitrospiraceae bacterium]|nr:GAF domain-containing protein [Nitrospiraceae bacterium]
MSIKPKILLLLIAFAVIPAVLLGLVVFPHERDSIVALRLAQLNTIADLKKDKIETFFRERAADINAIRNLDVVEDELPLLLRNPNGPSGRVRAEAKKMLDARLKPIQENYEYLDVMLVNPHGVVVYASGEGHRQDLGGPLADRRASEEGRKGVYFTDIYYDKGHFVIAGVAPIRNPEGELEGEVAVEIDMGAIYRFIGDTTGLGNTGEALIVRKRGDGVVFLSPLRGDPAAALKKTVRFDEKTAYPAQKAVTGENGSGVSVDYGGEQVLAAWRNIPYLRWGLIAKIDTAEAFAAIGRLKILLLVVQFFVIVLGIFAAAAVAKGVTGPILALEKGAEIIGGGDLDHRVATQATDEVGRLSRAFDAMTRHLRSVIHDYQETSDALRKAKERSEILSETAAGLLESDRPQDVVDGICRKVMGFLDCHVFFNYLVDEKAGRLRLNAYSGVSPEEAAAVEWLDFGAGVCGCVARNGVFIVCEDIPGTPDPRTDRVRPLGITAYACHPLLSGGRVIGTLSFGTRSRTAFGREDLAMMKTVAGQVAIALERMLLLESEKLRAAELEAVNRELESFAYSVSHDLRTPLRSIDGFSLALLEDYADRLDAEGKDYLERVRAATQHMGGLIDDILKLSRLTRADMKSEGVDLGEIAHGVARRLAEAHPGRRVEVKIAEGMEAEGDERLLAIVLENLMGNAWKFTERSDPAIIEVGSMRQDGEKIFFVRDNGVGFDMRYANKLFQPFQRLHDAGDFGGTGIGLATVKRIVERHRGRVWIEGETGRGAAVFFTLC